MNESEQPNEAATRPASAPREPMAVIEELRRMVLWLGAGLLVVSAAFCVFVFKQNRNLKASIGLRTKQAAQVKQVADRMTVVVNELARYSQGKPELIAIFQRHGIEIMVPGTPAVPQPGQP
jgi:hypothetical protein